MSTSYLLFSIMFLTCSDRLFKIASAEKMCPCTETDPDYMFNITKEIEGEDIEEAIFTELEESMDSTMSLLTQGLGFQVSQVVDKEFILNEEAHCLQGSARSVRVHFLRRKIKVYNLHISQWAREDGIVTNVCGCQQMNLRRNRNFDFCGFILKAFIDWRLEMLKAKLEPEVELDEATTRM